MEKKTTQDIERMALQGNIYDAWNSLLENTGINPNDIKEDYWFNTATTTSSKKQVFVNDVLPNIIKEKDDSKETEKIILVLMAASSAYNVDWGKQQNYDKSHSFMKIMTNITKLVDKDNRHYAYSAMADMALQSPKEIQKLFPRKESLRLAVETSPTMNVANLYANSFIYNQDTSPLEAVEVIKKALSKEEVLTAHAVKANLNYQLAASLNRLGDFKEEQKVLKANEFGIEKHAIKWRMANTSKEKSGVIKADELAVQKIAQLKQSQR